MLRAGVAALRRVAGYLARRWRLACVIVVVALAASAAGAGGWWWYQVHDPLAGELEALADDPWAALDYLAPQDGGSGGGQTTGTASPSLGGQATGTPVVSPSSGPEAEGAGLWVPSGAATARWGGLSSRRWGDRGLEALAPALAAVSSLRTSGDAQVRARASWATGQGMRLFARVPVGRVDRLGGGVKKQLAVVVASCAPEVVRIAQGQAPGGGLGLDAADTTGSTASTAGGSTAGSSSRGGGVSGGATSGREPSPTPTGGAVAWAGGAGVVASVVYRVVDDRDAVVTLSAALATRATRGGASTVEELEGVYSRVSGVKGLVWGARIERGADLEAGGDQERAEALSRAWGLGEAVFTTVTGARASQAAARAAAPLLVGDGEALRGPLVVDRLPQDTQSVLESKAAADPGLLEVYAYAEAVNNRLVAQEVLAPQTFIDPATCDIDPATREPVLSTGEYYSWYNQPTSKDDPVISLPDLPGAGTVGDMRAWAMSNQVADRDKDGVLGGLRSSTIQGSVAALELVLGADQEPGGQPGQITINKEKD